MQLGGVILDSKKNTLLPPSLKLVASLEKLNGLSQWKLEDRLHFPDAQCMVYLPTFTPKTTQIM